MVTIGTGIKDVWSGPLTRVDTTDKEGLGILRMEGGKIYKYVKFDNGTANLAAVVGNVCYYKGAAGKAANLVTMDLSDGVGIGAGVFQSIIPDQGFGWIQVRGPATLTTALTAGADGNALTAVGATDGTLDVSALVTDHVCAIADDASLKMIDCQFPL